jgi:imidazole glycerol-phosphate synthase subunit HisH
MIGIINYGSGNVSAISNVYKRLKVEHVISNDIAELKSADRYILPGVGAFDPTMCSLGESGLIEMLREQVLVGGKYILGICVGMQILAGTSDEGEAQGLGWIPGRVTKIQSPLESLKLPHMGWNSIAVLDSHPIFSDVDCKTGFYFLHNYYFRADDSSHTLATVEYGAQLTCAVGRDNILGVQFHPEKSHNNGVAIFRNFASLGT